MGWTALERRFALAVVVLTRTFLYGLAVNEANWSSDAAAFMLLFQPQTGQTTLLPKLTTVSGCHDKDSCVIDLGWQSRHLGVPAGGTVALSNLVIQNVVLDVQRAGAFTGLLSEHFLLPSAFNVAAGAVVRLENITVITNCSFLDMYSTDLLNDFLYFENVANNAGPSSHPDDDLQPLIWAHKLQMLPGKMYVNALNTTMVVANNVTYTCNHVGHHNQATTNTRDIPYVIDQAFSSDHLRELIEILAQDSPNVFVSLQANVSLTSDGLWGMSQGPALIIVNTSLVGVPWTDIVLDVQDRVGVFEIQGNVTLRLENLVLLNVPLGPVDAAPWNYLPFGIWMVAPPRNMVAKLLGWPTLGTNLVLRNIIWEDVEDLWAYFMYWGGRALNPIAGNTEGNFLLNLWDMANFTVKTTSSANVDYLFANDLFMYDVAVHWGAEREYTSLRNTTHIDVLTNNKVVPLSACIPVFDLNNVFGFLLKVLYMSETNFAVWVMQPITFLVPDNISLPKFPEMTKRSLMVGYDHDQVLDFNATMLPLTVQSSGASIFDSLIMVNLPTTWTPLPNLEWSMLQCSAWPIVSLNLFFTLRNVVFVVSEHEVAFLATWGSTLLGVSPAHVQGNHTLNYSMLRKFGYNGFNITVTSRCPEGIVCLPSQANYDHLVSNYIVGSDFQAAPPPAMSSGGSSGLSQGDKIAIVVCCVLGVPLLVAVICVSVVVLRKPPPSVREERLHDCNSLEDKDLAGGSGCTPRAGAAVPTHTHSHSCTCTTCEMCRDAAGRTASDRTVCSDAPLLSRHNGCGNGNGAGNEPSVLDAGDASKITATNSYGTPGLQRQSWRTRLAPDLPRGMGLEWSLGTSHVMQALAAAGVIVAEPAGSVCDGDASSMLAAAARPAEIGLPAVPAAEVLRLLPGNRMEMVSELVAKMPNIEEDQNLIVQELLGHGGCGSVHKATWRGLTVAVKTLLLPGGDAHMLEKAAQEVALLLKSYHKNVVAMYSYQVRILAAVDEPVRTTRSASSSSCCGPSDLKVFIIQEYCNSGTLQAAIDRGQLGITTGQASKAALGLALDIARGMAYVHSRHIVHGDLTPNNVLLQQRPQGVGAALEAKVADFGLAVSLGTDRTHVTRSIQGTTHYIAPEVFISGCTSKPADVYAFGVILWELVHGTPPWRSEEPDDSVSMRRSPLRLSPDNVSLHTTLPALAPSCHALLAELVRACTATEPTERPSFDEVASALAAAQLELGFASPPPTSPPATAEYESCVQISPHQQSPAHTHMGTGVAVRAGASVYAPVPSISEGDFNRLLKLAAESESGSAQILCEPASQQF